jgi:biotin transport system ATP-binding protein
VNPAARLSHVSKVFRVLTGDEAEGGRVRKGLFYALDDVSLDIEQGVCTVIAGANGSGKSLLISIIAGLDDYDEGKVEVFEKTGLIFQDADSQILGETPREDIAIGVGNTRGFGAKKNETPRVVEDSLRETGLLPRADFPSRFLSGGEKRRLAVAGVLAMNAELIICDEPYANLDYAGVIQVNTLLTELIAKNKTIVILTHELEKCLALAKNFIVLYNGKAVFSGTAREALQDHLEAWGIHNPLRAFPRFEDLVWR